MEHPLVQERPADFVHNISMEIDAAGGGSTPNLFTWLYSSNVEVLFSYCYSNASVFCAWFRILIFLALAFNTDVFSETSSQYWSLII